jgi:hypothetical protein
VPTKRRTLSDLIEATHTLDDEWGRDLAHLAPSERRALVERLVRAGFVSLTQARQAWEEGLFSRAIHHRMVTERLVELASRASGSPRSPRSAA